MSDKFISKIEEQVEDREFLTNYDRPIYLSDSSEFDISQYENYLDIEY